MSDRIVQTSRICPACGVQINVWSREEGSPGLESRYGARRIAAVLAVRDHMAEACPRRLRARWHLMRNRTWH